MTSFINDAFGWRDSVLIVSGIGATITLSLFLLEEPIRQAERGTQALLENAIERKSGVTVGTRLSRMSRLMTQTQ